MIDRIDCDRRLSPEEHDCLYRYFQAHTANLVGYRDFPLTEALIAHYNRAPAAEKQRLAQQMRQDPQHHAFVAAFQQRPWEWEKPVLWGDRAKTPYFIAQSNASHSFEVYLDALFGRHGVDLGLYYGREQQYHMGETALGIEIKYDKRSAETGNYYIEYQERMRSSGSWVNSGILKADNTRFYLLGTIDKFVIFERSWLLEYYTRLVQNHERLPDARLVQERTHHTSKGFILLPSAWARGNIPFQRLLDEFL